MHGEDKNGLVHGFFHTKNSQSLKVGNQIKEAQKIGESDLSGRSIGLHFHYTIDKDGKRTDPDKYLQENQAENPLNTSRETIDRPPDKKPLYSTNSANFFDGEDNGST